MPSASDLDQGGTIREWIRTYLGPTVGWVMMQASNILAVTSAGTTTVVTGTTLVTVNKNSPVTIQLPSAIANPVIPYTLFGQPMTIVDIGGFAGANNITILPFGTEKISGQNSLAISTPYGAYTIFPDTINGGWNFE